MATVHEIKIADTGTDELILEQGRRIRALHEIISRPDLSFDEQIDETLRLGCNLLGTEIGKVGRQEPENNASHFLNTVTMTNLPVRRGLIFPLDKTFCQITFAAPDTIAISHVAESEYKDTPAAKFLGVQSYIGCSINVHGKKFGTVNFSNRAPVAKPFTEADKDLVKLIGSWISVMMERQLEAEELRHAKEKAEAANLAKTTFLANMSHEIRTPLTSIIGFADGALDAGQTMEQRVAALVAIRHSSDHLLHLINDVLDFSKIEAGELDIDKHPADLLQIIADVESIVRGHALKKNLDFNIDYEHPLPKTVFTDALRVKQILLNLISNAVKFTQAGSVRIVVKYDVERSMLQVSVIDTGIGMSDEQAKNIFRPFKQADASISRRFGGTGLGLSLSRRLAELLGGDLSVKSIEGKGSIFTLNLKLEFTADMPIEFVHANATARSKEDAMQAVNSQPKLQGEILVAEDNEANQQIIKRFLEIMGASVTIAANGEIAVEQAKQRRYDLIYMDMQMPIMSGIDAVITLRDQNYQGPIVMLTANATLEYRTQCKQAGCEDFVTKPIDRQKLYEVTAKYLPKQSP